MGTQLSDLFCLESYRAYLPVSTMSAGSIVVDFNVFEYNTSHFLSRFKSLTMDGLDLQGVKEALCTGIIVTITRAAHAANKTVFCQQALVKRGTILAAAI